MFLPPQPLSVSPSCTQVALMTRFNGIGYTFVLAGFLKIVTVGGLVMSAPVDAARTAFGKASPYLMVPVGLALCWVAKQVGTSVMARRSKLIRHDLLVIYSL
eukprot:GHUV01031985.1.p2 GENE.GHUV01031985.1~~GHUV01031985.1.p2  ORF type:complete len:102 (+),score=14.64 GHUV01031985.1:1226-1531(+)